MNEKINTTQEIAIDFAQRAVSAINSQLAVEIKRNGYELKKIRTGAHKLNRTVRASETDPRHVVEVFSITMPKAPERIIMCVKWSPKGFEIERNSDAVANAIKANKSFGVKKGQNPLFVGELTEREVQIEAIAADYERKDEERLKKESGIRVIK